MPREAPSPGFPGSGPVQKMGDLPAAEWAFQAWCLFRWATNATMFFGFCLNATYMVCMAAFLMLPTSIPDLLGSAEKERPALHQQVPALWKKLAPCPFDQRHHFSDVPKGSRGTRICPIHRWKVIFISRFEARRQGVSIIGR
jgi:hypothetical protein